MDMKERLRIANKVNEEDMKKKSDKERVAELEAENKDLMDAIVELADIIAGGGE